MQIDAVGGKELLKNRRFVLTAGTSTNAPVYRGYTDEQGIVRIPVYDRQVEMRLKVDIGGYLLDPPASAATDPPQADDPADTDAGDGDSDAWEDEDTFYPLTLQCGELLPIDDPGYGPAQQRLYNLGYGTGRPLHWDQRTAYHAIKSFQAANDLQETGAIDQQTRDRIRQLHGG